MNTVLLAIKETYVEKVRSWTDESAWYVLAGLVLLAQGAMNGLVPGLLPQWMFWISVFLLLCGFIEFVRSDLVRIWRSPVGKLVVSAFVFISSTVALVLARQSLNSELQVPADAFPITLSLLAFALSPMAIFIVAMPISVLLLVVGIVFFFAPARLSSLTAKNVLLGKFPLRPVSDGEIGRGFGRYISVIFIVAGLNWGLKNNSYYAGEVFSWAKSFAYNLEAERYSWCKHGGTERVAYLSNNMIVLASKLADGGYSFRVDKCIQDIKY